MLAALTMRIDPDPALGELQRALGVGRGGDRLVGLDAVVDPEATAARTVALLVLGHAGEERLVGVGQPVLVDPAVEGDEELLAHLFGGRWVDAGTAQRGGA